MWEEVVCTLSVALPLPLLKKGVQTKQESLRLFWGAQGERPVGGGTGGEGSGSIKELCNHLSKSGGRGLSRGHVSQTTIVSFL